MEHKRGIVKREQKIRAILLNENVDVLFLNETDTLAITTEKDYVIKGYYTILQNRKDAGEKLRLICLIKENLSNIVKIRQDLMSSEFLSIWIKVDHRQNNSILVSGFYREWNHKGEKTEESQVECINIFNQQINMASKSPQNRFELATQLNGQRRI